MKSLLFIILFLFFSGEGMNLSVAGEKSIRDQEKLSVRNSVSKTSKTSKPSKPSKTSKSDKVPGDFTKTDHAHFASDSELLAHWKFDEKEGDRSLINSVNTQFNAQADRVVKRVPGLFGNALDLSGSFRLAIDKDLVSKKIQRLTFSVWSKPRNLSDFREIIRKEDGNNRFLFSFQEGGRYLSLGLNINDVYYECDAPAGGNDLIDGQWHFLCASFDGQTMKVYLDGRLIGSRVFQLTGSFQGISDKAYHDLKNKRPFAGQLNFGGDAPIMIGSSSGTSEYFDGLLDDLRFYSRALSENEILALYREGVLVIDRLEMIDAGLIDRLYQKDQTCCSSLEKTRLQIQKIFGKPTNTASAVSDGKVSAGADANSGADSPVAADPKLLAAILRRVRLDFSKEYSEFNEVFRFGALHFLTSSNDEIKKEINRVLEQALEYKPLTSEQLSSLSQPEREKWNRLEKMEKDLRAIMTVPNAVPRDLQKVIEFARLIQERPKDREAVAPYQIPVTPEVVDLTPQQARQKIEQDWLFQTNGNPSPARILLEIARTRDLIARMEEKENQFAAERTALSELGQKAARLTKADPALYFQVRTIKRKIMFSNPAIDFDSILYIDQPYPQGSEWRHEARHRLGYMAGSGGRLMTLKGLSPDGKQKMLLPQAPLHGAFWRPDLSYDAKRVLVSYKPHNEKSFHIYEIGIDGGKTRQLTGGIFDDFDPIYLPDGKNILFSTTRGYTYVRCMPPTNAFVLARMGLDSKNLYLVSRNNEPDYLPSVLPDGRIVYSRWEYTDKPLWRCVSLWTMNPDGTQVQILWGNQTVWPDLPKDVRAIPGSSKLIFTGSAHHNWFAGSIGIIDPTRGLNFPDGLTKITAEVRWPECGNGPVDPIESDNYYVSGNYTAYDSPYPLSECEFLVSACRDGKYVLLLMDTDGNRELIYEGAYNIFYAQPIRPREVPPVLVDRVDWPKKEDRAHPAPGLIYSNNVYANAPPELKGKAKFLRIMNIEPKTYTLWNERPYISTGPVISMVQDDGVKKVLGTVPIEEDGSVSFHVPSGMALHFQLLDKDGKCLQTMRSFTGVMPGEQRGCLGCHETHNRTPVAQGRSIALTKKPQTIIPPSWNDISVSYERYVQPTLDKHCGKCHEGEGEARKILDLTLRPGFLHFNEPYITLVGKPTWAKKYQKPEQTIPGFGIADTILVEGYSTVDPEAYVTPKPLEKLSYASRLINKYCVPAHYDVKLSPMEMQRMMIWVDAMCPYLGTDDIRRLPDPKFQGSDWLAIPPRLETAPVVRRPGPFDPWGIDDAYDPPKKEKIYGNPAVNLSK